MSAIDRIMGGAPKTAPSDKSQQAAPAKKNDGLFAGVENFMEGLFGKKQEQAPSAQTQTNTPAPAPSTGGAIARIKGSASPKTTQAQPTTTAPSGAIARIMGTQKTPSYFGTTTKDGISYGPAPEKDASGRPFIEYKLPGQTASTTDKTRTAVSFDPSVAAPQTKETFYNPRAVENKAQLRIALGGAYSDELDHKIAAALSGSNAPENLRPVPAEKNNDSTKILELQQKVVKGQISLFDAQIELAKWKGIDVPWTPKETKKYSTFDGAIAALKDKWTNKIAPAIDSVTERRDQAIEQPYFEPRKKTETPAQYSARLQTFQNSPEMAAYQQKVKDANSFGGIVKETVKNIPNKLSENAYATFGIGGAVKAIRDNPEDAANIQAMDAVKNIPKATVDVATGFVKAPVSGALNLYGAAAGAMFNDPAKGAVKFSIPGLGEFSNANARVIDRINAGEDATQVALEEGSTAIFDTLFFFGVASKAFAPRTTVTARFKGDLNAVKKEGSPAIDVGPKSFREYTPPSTAAPLTPKVINAMSEQGMSLGAKYDPTLPSFFRIRSTGKGGNVIGEVVQVKPSYFDVLVNKITPKTKLDYYRTSVKNSQAFDVDTAIKEGQVPKDAVYQKGKILTEDFAKGRIDDVAQKLDQYKPGLGNEFRAKVDPKNTSLPGLIEQGEAMLTPAILKNPSPQIQAAIIAESIPTIPTRLTTSITSKEVPVQAIRDGLENPTPAVQEAPQQDLPAVSTPNPLDAITAATKAPSRYQSLPQDFSPSEPTPSDINPMEVVAKNSAAYQALEVAAEAKVDQDLKIYKQKENLPLVYERTVKTIEHSLKMADNLDERRYWNQQLELAKFKVDYVKKKLTAATPEPAADLPTEKANIEVVKDKYKAAGEGQYGGYKADDVLGQILIELELAEKGERIMTPSSEPGVNYTFSAKRSTFPEWIPENLRSRKAIDNLLSKISSIDTLAYPEKTTATAQRDFVNALLDTLDYRLGVDTKAERAKITTNERPKEKRDTKEAAPKKVSSSTKRGGGLINEEALSESKRELKENRARREEIKAELETTETGPRALKLTAELNKLEDRAKRLSRIVKDAENLAEVSTGPVEKPAEIERTSEVAPVVPAPLPPEVEVTVPKKPLSPEKVPEHNMFEKAWEMEVSQKYEKTKKSVESIGKYLEEAKALKPQVDKIPRRYADRTAEQREILYRYETLTDKRNKEFYDFWTGPSLRDPKISRLEALKEPGESAKTSYRRIYIENVKKLISQGYDVPEEMIAQYPEFKTAATARARYEKGYKTSFANKSSAIDLTPQKEYGFKVKRQDGKPITATQIAEITKASEDLAAAIGPFKDIAERIDLTVAHTSGKFPFLRGDAGGLHIGKENTISVGVAVNGRAIKAFAHEMFHVFDNTSGTMGKMITKHISRGGSYNEELITKARQEMNGSGFQIDRALKAKPNMTQAEKDSVQLLKGRLTGYYRTAPEIFARLGEQYVADKLGYDNAATDSIAFYHDALGYWSKDTFNELKPMIEAEINRKMDLARTAEVERAKFDRTTPVEFNATLDEAVTEIRKLFRPEEVEVAFTKEFIGRTNLAGRFRSGPSIVDDGSLGKIELLTKEGKVSKDTAWHESFHAYFNLYLSPKEQQFMLNKVKALSVITKSGRYRDISSYDTADKRAEEFLADDFADWKASQEGGPKYQGFFARVWQKFMGFLKNLRRRILGADKIYKDMVAGKRPNMKRQADELEVSRALELSDEDMKHISEIIESGATRAEAKNVIEQRRIRNENAARVTKLPDETIAQVFQNTLNPLKGVDTDTANVFRKWRALELSGEETARIEKKNAVLDLQKANIPDDMTTIAKYEAGQGGLPEVRAIFDNLYAEAGRLDDTDVGYLENYIPHVYSNSAAEFQQIAMGYLQGKGLTVEEAEDYLSGKKALPQAQARRLGLLPFFVKERMFDSYKEAIAWGLRPKYKTVSDLAAYYRGKLERALANRYLKQTLEEKGKILPDVQAPPGWSNLNPQFSALETYKAPAQVARIINDIFPDTNIRRLGPAILEKTAALSKKLQEITLSAGVPSSNINFFSNGQLIKEITSGNPGAAKAYARANSYDLSLKYLEEKAPIIMKMANQGIDLSSRIGKWGQTSFKDMVANKEWVNAFGRGFDLAFNEKTFGSFLPQLQIGLFEKVYNKSIAQGMAENQAADLAGSIVKNNFGLLTDDFARSKVVRDFLSTFFFAPRFREAILRMLTNAGYSGYDFIRNPRRPNPAYRSNLYFLAGLAITYALYNLLNKELNGNFLWQNPDGREFALRIPRENGDVFYVEILPGTLAFPRAIATGALALGRGDLKMATQKFGMLASQPVKLVTDVLGNEDYFGRPIYKETDGGDEKAKKIAAYLGLNATHPWIREIVNQVQDKNPLYQSVSIALELPIKFSSLSKEAQARIYAESDRKAKELAAAKEAFQPKYNAIRAKINDGDAVGALEDIRSLSKEEQAVYKSLKADDQALLNKEANKAVAPTFEAIQELLSEGRNTEALDMYKALPADQKKAYNRFKARTK